MMNKAMSKFFTVDGTPKREKQKEIMKSVTAERGTIKVYTGYLSCLEGGEIMSTKNIEEKQYLLRFRADTKSHLTVMDDDICMTKCPDKICTIFCPAEVYKWEG